MEAVEQRTNALRIPGFLSTHPVFSDRIAKLQLKVSYICIDVYVCIHYCWY